MLRFLGTPRTLCDGVSRSDLLHAGALSLCGLTLDHLAPLGAASAPRGGGDSFGRAKSCLLIHLFGAPPQHETFDPKPQAPAEIRGEMQPISTALPGVAFCEGLPETARIADRLTIVRSMTHAWPFHAVNYSLSGIPAFNPTREADPNDRVMEWPFLGSVIDYLDSKHESNAARRAKAIPPNLALPFPLYAHVNFRLIGGPYAGFLGQKHDPLWTSFDAKGTRKVPTLVEGPEVYDPYGGIRPEDRFEIGGSAAAGDPNSIRRLGFRRSLLDQFDLARRDLDQHSRVANYDHQRLTACDMLTTSRLRQALDVQRESATVRERYGMDLFGQSLLAARRVIEAGGKFVTVFWDAYGHFAAGWDTHTNHYPRLREFLLPGFDKAFPALILDLEERGMLDDTLVLCVSEHGRTPKLTNCPGAGREHWSRVYSSVFAGGGMGRGQVIGQSDRIGGDVAVNPISPKDILASAFHLLGVDPHTTIPDSLGRPVNVAGDGLVRRELFG